MTDRLGVRRLVMGHTPNFEGMVSRCNGTILLIDTGISPAYSTFSTFSLTFANQRWRADSLRALVVSQTGK